MTLPETFQAAGAWAGVALVQMTLVGLLGLLCWLAARRAGPALRGAVVLAALLGLLVVPVLAAVAPVWLPLPECLCPAAPASVPAEPADAGPAPPATDPGEFAILVTQLPDAAQPDPDDPAGLLGDAAPPAKAQGLVINLSGLPEDAGPAVRPGEPPAPSWSPAGVLAALWGLGAIVFLIRALVRLALLYRCAWRARSPRESGPALGRSRR